MIHAEPNREHNTHGQFPIPNLQIMLHHYSCVEHLFTTVTMYAAEERERLFDSIVQTKNWFWGRYAPKARQDYMATRLFVEAQMHDAFSKKYGTPPSPHPVFFYLFPNLSLPAIEERLRQRRQYDEPNTTYLLVDIKGLCDLRHISFTLGDSHQSYRDVLRQHGFPTEEGTTLSADSGNVFHIHELYEVYSRHSESADLSFEIQVWNPEILVSWKAEHGFS